MEAVTLARLKRRNRDARAACTLTNSCRAVLAQHAALQEKSARQQQRLDLQEKEKHEMAADLQLLQQNEANAGVSSEHIQLLQQQLELAKGEAHAEVRAASPAPHHRRHVCSQELMAWYCHSSCSSSIARARLTPTPAFILSGHAAAGVAWRGDGVGGGAACGERANNQTLALALTQTLALTPALALALALNLNLSLTRTLTHQGSQAARHLKSPSLVRVEMHRTLDAVHSVFVRLALGGLCEEFAVYVPAEGRDYWRTLASTSVDGTTGCMERPVPVSRKENATHQLGYQP